MGFGFSFKLAPGVRVRASTRGIRSSVGPRAARIHVGAGRTTVSTGAGPVTLYSSSRGGRRRSSGAVRKRTAVAAQQRQLKAAAKLNQAKELADAWNRLLTIHQEDFETAEPPVAPSARVVDEAGIRSRHKREAMHGISVFKRAERKQAASKANLEANVEIAAEQNKRDEERAEVQRSLDEEWARLLANDPDVVIETLEEAFEDNEAPAAAVGVDGDEVSLVVLVPGTEELPERKPTTTDAGNLSLKKLTKQEGAELYKAMVAGYVLVTMREAFAVSPGIAASRVVVLRSSGTDAYGKRQIECLLATRIARKAFDGVAWTNADSVKILNATQSELVIKEVGRTKELQPIDLAGHEELGELIKNVDTDELLASDS